MLDRGYSPPKLEKGMKKTAPGYRRPSLRSLKSYSEPVRYGYAVGRIKVLESRLLTPHRLNRLIEADYSEALHILDEVELGDYLMGARVAGEVDVGLIRYLRDVYSLLEEMLPEDSCLVDFFLSRYDFHNLKVILKSRMDGKEEGLLPGLGRLEVEELREGIDEPKLLPPAYRAALEEIKEAQLSPQETDMVMDKHFFSYRLQLAEGEKNAFLKEYARTAIDFANLKTIVRGRKLGKGREFMQLVLVEGGKLGKDDLLELYEKPYDEMIKALGKARYPSTLMSFMEGADEIVRLTDFDRRVDDYLMELTRRARRISVGMEPIFGYVKAREVEVTVVRIILMGKLHNLSPADIEKMVRKLYVE